MAISPNELTFVRDFVYRRSAIVLGPEKEYLVEARLGPIARAEGFASVTSLIGGLRTQKPNGLHTRVIEAMTTHETTFFRDVHPFEAMKDEILPALRKSRALSKSIYIWCAGCSSGQEPYSVAMQLADHFPDLASWPVRIVATDLSTAVLARAREATFNLSEVNRGLTPEQLARHFHRVGSEWQLAKPLRSAVEFKQMNLIEPWPSLPRVDVLFLRNVLIYFDVATKKAILSRVTQVLAPDGYLFLGGAETTLNVDDNFQRVQVGKAVFYRPRHGAAK